IMVLSAGNVLLATGIIWFSASSNTRIETGPAPPFHLTEAAMTARFWVEMTTPSAEWGGICTFFGRSIQVVLSGKSFSAVAGFPERSGTPASGGRRAPV